MTTKEKQKWAEAGRKSWATRRKNEAKNKRTTTTSKKAKNVATKNPVMVMAGRKAAETRRRNAKKNARKNS